MLDKGGYDVMHSLWCALHNPTHVFDEKKKAFTTARLFDRFEWKILKHC